MKGARLGGAADSSSETALCGWFLEVGFPFVVKDVADVHLYTMYQDVRQIDNIQEYTTDI